MLELLNQLDGFTNQTTVKIIAATNRWGPMAGLGMGCWGWLGGCRAWRWGYYGLLVEMRFVDMVDLLLVSIFILEANSPVAFNDQHL